MSCLHTLRCLTWQVPAFEHPKLLLPGPPSLRMRFVGVPTVPRHRSRHDQPVAQRSDVHVVPDPLVPTLQENMETKTSEKVPLNSPTARWHCCHRCATPYNPANFHRSIGWIRHFYGCCWSPTAGPQPEQLAGHDDAPSEAGGAHFHRRARPGHGLLPNAFVSLCDRCLSHGWSVYRAAAAAGTHHLSGDAWRSPERVLADIFSKEVADPCSSLIAN